MSRTRKDRNYQKMPSGKTSFKKMAKRWATRKIRYNKNFDLVPVVYKTIYFDYYW